MSEEKVDSLKVSEWLVQYLNQVGINYLLIEHGPFHSCADNDLNLQAVDVKNILLWSRSKKIPVLLVIPCEGRVNFKNLKNYTGIKDLSFASRDTCIEVLGAEPGSLSVLGLLYGKKMCKVFIDSSLLDQKLQLHPCDNRKTVVMWFRDLIYLLNQNTVDFEVIKII
ncbi:MAG: hypothetical protein NZO16_05855 [Deltaproteobacteria bacterium]|nr:hypothetical protein [Deltaproteobacteria bacterium]